MSNTNSTSLDIKLQNRMIISLLGRLVFPEDKLISIVQKKSKKPKEILQANNLCTGEFTITEIAKKSGITQQALSEAITKWKKTGIVFLESRGRGHEMRPIHLYELDEDSSHVEIKNNN